MDTLKKESKSMFSSETLDSMAMAEVYGGLAEGMTLEMEMEMDAARKANCFIAKCYCPTYTYCKSGTKCVPECGINCNGCFVMDADTFAVGDVAVMATPVAMTAISPVAVDFTR